MSQQFLSPETVIAALKQSLDNFQVSEIGKGNQGAKFHNVTLKCPDGVSRPILVNVNTPMVIYRGVANPATPKEQDSRNTYPSKDETLKATFELHDATIREMFMLIDAAYIAAVRKMQQRDVPILGDEVISPVVDFGRALQQNSAEKAKNIKALKADPHAFQEGFAYSVPRTDMKISFSKYSDKHPNSALRNRIKSEIFDGSRPIRANDRTVGYFPAEVDGQQINYAKAYKFINDGAIFLRTRFDMSSVIAAALISFPCLINYAIITSGAPADPHAGISFDDMPAPDVPVAPIPATPIPAAAPTAVPVPNAAPTPDAQTPIDDIS